MTKLNITDTTLRDAHQSLAATRMRTEDMLELASAMEKAGFWSVEAWGGATFDTCIRYLNDDPWERLRDLKTIFVRTPIQMLLRGQNLVGYKHYPDDVVDKFIGAAAANGVDVFRVFDALNDIRNMKRSMTAVLNEGKHLQGTISYTTSPVHSTEGFIAMAEELYSLGCNSICIKDMAGLIMPEATRALITGIKKRIDIPVCLHTHSTSGIAPMSYQAAIEAGVDILDTAMSPFAGGTSQPATESIVASLAGTKRDTGIKLTTLRDIKNAASTVRCKYDCLIDPISVRIDSDVLIYQLPGGMISNLVSQLKEQGALDKMDEVLTEIPVVRKDLGYPPLVTPTSQIVGTQAVLNVLMGGRYKTVTNEVRDYLKGMYGKSPAPLDEALVASIIGDEERITCRPADTLSPIYDKMKTDAEGQDLIRKEEDVLTYILYPAIAPAFLKGEKKAEPLPETVPAGAAAAAPVDIDIPRSMEVEVDGEVFMVRILSVEGESVAAGSSEPGKRQTPHGDVPGGVKSSIQGMVLDIKVQMGQKVAAGDTLLVLEAMKMENPVVSPVDGTVTEIFVENGAVVQSGDVLVVVK
ncbi:pyruvate/oxaloacetate carboxyltransferase [Methanocorpusculum sp. MG]|uniref:Pyruvate/oxaloacetate carboxyltransferase n=1 Tax=Methanocorpusculum petauri TaxID=3002863 RepID=A0ABT4IDF1_9EURY|nr:pyruvate/oxaloacetate carboxyltransferase [Methanocorpusculum petauri]MCZ0859761.1 pyruvate/oxaloacetate carboxyltransferase [Methanocorpusculum petauri]MDE2442974.1 pyruvate/oxaloacetate carboxyltransferase [Methanocorpusculum sp.]